MNLYGESGNIKAIKTQLENQGIKVKIHFLSIDDKLDFSKYDFVYIGSGTEENQKLALKHLIKYKNDIKNYIEDDKFFLVTGNAIELFGQYIIADKKIKALELFPFETKLEDFRIVGESLMNTSFLKSPLLGFQNRNGVLKNSSIKPLGIITMGTGYSPNVQEEGILYKNFYGTYLIGPILVRNPEFVKYIIKKLVVSKKKDFKFKKFNLYLEEKAYQEFIKKYK
jgi:hypothetical protein